MMSSIPGLYLAGMLNCVTKGLRWWLLDYGRALPPVSHLTTQSGLKSKYICQSQLLLDAEVPSACFFFESGSQVTMTAA